MSRSAILCDVIDKAALTPLGRRIEARKDELGLSQRDVARHTSTYQTLVTGGRVERRTQRRAFINLGWDPESLDDVLAGGEPRPLKSESEKPPNPEGDFRVAFEVGGMVASGWPALTAAERQVVRDMAERAHRRLHDSAAEDNRP